MNENGTYKLLYGSYNNENDDYDNDEIFYVKHKHISLLKEDAN